MRADFVKTLRFWSDRGVDGFRIDVAHMLTKDLTEPLPSRAELEKLPFDGKHPLIDRDDVHEIYAEWRRVFNEYDPPRTAVAEAWVEPHRVPLYANPDSLGQAFNFDLLQADFDAREFREIVTDNLALAAASGSSSTWVLSNHDVVRHATRYGLPKLGASQRGRGAVKQGSAWLHSGGTEPELDRAGGLRRARAATLFLLGLPGSAYLYQGEELGLHEVAEIPASERQDPTFFRTGGEEIGRDGCRVPLPWSADLPFFGFGGSAPHLPQPAWFAESAADVQAKDPALDALALPAGARASAPLADRRDARVARHGPCRRPEVPPAERLGGHHQLRRGAVPPRRRARSPCRRAARPRASCPRRPPCGWRPPDSPGDGSAQIIPRRPVAGGGMPFSPPVCDDRCTRRVPARRTESS